MRVCRSCEALESSTPWVTLRGKNQGLLCLSCKRSQNKSYSQKIRSTPEGKAKSNEASKLYQQNLRSTENGRVSSNNAHKLWRQSVAGQAYTKSENRKKGVNKSSLNWARNSPYKANAKAMKRHAMKLQRTPKWLTLEHYAQMLETYAKAKAQGKQVDHIIPLQGELVSGLHVPWNLQILTAIENQSKGNRV